MKQNISNLTVEDVRALLRKAMREAGNQTNWGKKYGFTKPFVSMVINGEKSPSTRMCEIIGVKKRVWGKIVIYKKAET